MARETAGTKKKSVPAEGEGGAGDQEQQAGKGGPEGLGVPKGAAQQVLGGDGGAVDEAIKKEIVEHLRQGKAFEEARISAGKAEKEHKDAAQALMNKYYPRGFQAGEGEGKVVGFFEVKKKLKIRTGENAEMPEETAEISDNDPGTQE